MNVEIPWSDVVVGHFVWNAELGWMRVADKHPADPIRFRLLDSLGNVHDVSLPGWTKVWVSAPNEEQAMAVLESVFGHIAKESIRIVDPSQRAPGMPPPRTYV